MAKVTWLSDEITEGIVDEAFCVIEQDTVSGSPQQKEKSQKKQRHYTHGD